MNGLYLGNEEKYICWIIILEFLKVWKSFNSDTERLYEMGSRDVFEGAWPKYLEELRSDMTVR